MATETDHDSIGLVRLTGASSPSKLEAALRKQLPELVGSLLNWSHDDWFAVSPEVASSVEALDAAHAKAAGVLAFRRVHAQSFREIASLRSLDATKAMQFELRDLDVAAQPPVTVDPPIFSWPGDYGGKPVELDWHIAALGLPKAWSALPAGPTAYSAIRVGHIDTGYTEHPALGFGSTGGTWLRPDLGKNFWKDKATGVSIGEGGGPWSATPEFPGSRDNLTGAHAGHGTRTSSVIAGLYAPDGAPIAFPYFGAAPGATVIPYRIADSVIIDHVPDLLAAAINDAVAQGVAVISISLGALRRDARVAAAVRAAYDRGVIICAAAGQVFRSVIYPGALDEVITLGGATTTNGRDFHPWRTAARGKEVDVCGPADQIRRANTVSSDDGLKFRISGPGDGTSFATALCAGTAVLWLARHGAALDAKYAGAPWGRVEAFRSLIKATAVVPTDWPTATFGAGVFQADKLVAADLPDLASLVRAV